MLLFTHRSTPRRYAFRHVEELAAFGVGHGRKYKPIDFVSHESWRFLHVFLFYIFKFRSPFHHSSSPSSTWPLPTLKFMPRTKRMSRLIRTPKRLLMMTQSRMEIQRWSWTKMEPKRASTKTAPRMVKYRTETHWRLQRKPTRLVTSWRWKWRTKCRGKVSKVAWYPTRNPLKGKGNESLFNCQHTKENSKVMLQKNTFHFASNPSPSKAQSSCITHKELSFFTSSTKNVDG